MDYGYDGYNFDNLSNDMYFINGANQLVRCTLIKNDSYPIVWKQIQGKVKFMIDGLENSTKSKNIYIWLWKWKLHWYHKKEYEVLIISGENNDRFVMFPKKEKKDKKTKI
jgi:hypothetical protein